MSNALAVRDPSTPKFCPPRQGWAKRRQRLIYVQNALLENESPSRIARAVSQKFGVTVRQGESDLAVVRRRWARDDEGEVNWKRRRTIQRIERFSVNAEREGNLAIALACEVAIGKFLGMDVHLREAIRDVDADIVTPDSRRLARAYLALAPHEKRHVLDSIYGRPALVGAQAEVVDPDSDGFEPAGAD